MKKSFAIMPFIVFTIFSTGCNGGTTNKNTDTSNFPAVTDTMPVLNPENKDSIGIKKTPPTNDNNAILPDSAMKSK